MTIHSHSRGPARRAAAAVATAAALLFSLLAFGPSPSASAAEFYGEPAGATATMNGPMISAGQNWGDLGTYRYVQSGGLTVSAAYYDAALGLQTVRINVALQRKTGASWSNVRTLEWNMPIEAGKPITVPSFRVIIGDTTAATDYRALYSVSWFGAGGLVRLGDGFMYAEAGDYQCLATVATPSLCTVTTSGIHI